MLFNILLFLVVLGVLVFFHELGHFLAAKACNIYCDRFSLGMPPRVWGIRWGETDYCIGALPIGGYVKMAGQEDAPKSAESRESEYAHVPPERWFNHRPVWQRCVVVLAGPVMNLILGYVLYVIVAAAGAEVPESKVDNRVGRIAPDSAAAAAPLYELAPGQEDIATLPAQPDAVGWETGDHIVTIDGDSVESAVPALQIAAVLGAGKPHRIVLEREDSSGGIRRFLSIVAPRAMAGDPYPKFGVAPYQTALVDSVMPDSSAEEHGLQKDDVILRANGKVVDAGSFGEMVERMTSDEVVAIDVQRGDAVLHFELHPKRVGRFRDVVFDPPLTHYKEDEASKRPVVADITQELREKSGLRRKDVIVEIDGQPATVALLRETEKTRIGEKVALKVMRPTVLFGLAQKEETRTASLEVSPVGQVGITYGAKQVYRRVPLLQAIPETIQYTSHTLELAGKSLLMLVVGNVSPRELGGPLMIYGVTAKSAELGYSFLLETTAFISISLFLFNLLPLPVLDGGLLVLLALEGIRRKPLDVRIMERLQQVGLVLIIGLMLFATSNDIMRMIQDMIP